jgi:hypothetical protein
MGAWSVIRTMFECPETGEPLASTMTVGRWPRGSDQLVSMHCPKCGKLHSFGAAHAILVIEARERTRSAAGASAG